MADKSELKKLKTAVVEAEKRIAEASTILNYNVDNELSYTRRKLAEAERAIGDALQFLDYDVDGATFAGPSRVVWRANMSAAVRLHGYRPSCVDLEGRKVLLGGEPDEPEEAVED